MRLTDALLDLARDQHAAIATWQAQGLGASRTEISRLRRSREWEVETSRVLRVAGAPLTRELRASVAALDAGRGAGLSHECGAAWWGVPGCRLEPFAVAQPEPRANNRSTIARLHDLLALPEEWTTVLNGVRVVRPELIVFQICGCVHPLRAERILDAAWSIGIVSGRSLRHAYDTFHKQGRNGSVVLHELLKARPDDYVPPATGLESRFQQLARDAGIATFKRQVDSGGERWCGRVDFRDESLPLIVEVQSELYHAALSREEDDAARFDALEDAGFAIIEAWDSAVWNKPRDVIAALQRARREVKARVSPAQRIHICVR